jgi:DNA-binding transcriptional MocR family regulator
MRLKWRNSGFNDIIVTMTNWQPDIALRSGPRYRAIAEALADDVRAGTLPAGTRLPTHRDLAWRLRVTIGTVSRAYAEAERRGLISGEVGRGTFVRAIAPAAPALRFHADATERDFIDFRVNRPRTASEAPLMARALAELAADPALGKLLDYHPHAGRLADRAAGARWIARTSTLATAAEQVVVTSGGQHAMLATLAAVTEPGDSLAVEALTYPGIRAAANLLRLKLVPVALDEGGIVPDALDVACRGNRVRAAYLLATLHNPTTATMPFERRRAIAEIARAHELKLIEDDLYGFLVSEPLPPLAAFAPTHAFYITAASKSFVPGLRVGYAHCPPALVERVAAAVHASTYCAAPMMAALATRWIEDGTGERLVAEKRAETARRQKIVERYFAAERVHRDPAASHLWLELPEEWRAEDFTAAAERRGVAIAPAAAFAASRQAPNAVRLCIGTPATAAEVERGLTRLAELLEVRPDAYSSVV